MFDIAKKTILPIILKIFLFTKSSPTLIAGRPIRFLFKVNKLTPYLFHFVETTMCLLIANAISSTSKVCATLQRCDYVQLNFQQKDVPPYHPQQNIVH